MATAKKAAKKPAAKKPAAKKPPQPAKKAAVEKGPGKEGRSEEARRQEGSGEAQAERSVHEGDDALGGARRRDRRRPAPRTEVTKKIWDYIKKNKLQDALNKRNINADDKLKAVFGGKKQGLDVRDDQARFEPPEVAAAHDPRTRVRITAGRGSRPAVCFLAAAPRHSVARAAARGPAPQARPAGVDAGQGRLSAAPAAA